MFELVELKDALRIAPQRFEDEEGAVRDEINKKYANKVRCEQCRIGVVAVELRIVVQCL